MASIRSTNTKVERLVFSHLRAQKIYFRRHYRHAPGIPDVAVPHKKLAVFIDGDFWHGRNYNKRTANLSEYWKAKIAGNLRRDKSNRAALRRAGWKVLRIWESDLNRKGTRRSTLDKIERHLNRLRD